MTPLCGGANPGQKKRLPPRVLVPVTDVGICRVLPQPCCSFHRQADKTPAGCSCPHLTEGETEAQRRSAAEQGKALNSWLQDQCSLHWTRRSWGQAQTRSECLVVLEPTGSSSLALSWPLVMERVRKRYFWAEAGKIVYLVPTRSWSWGPGREGAVVTAKTKSTQQLSHFRSYSNYF